MEAAASTVVIKVKYGDVLRRFNARIVGDQLDFTVDGLREKILSLFSVAPDVELILTYIDEDGDVVHLVDDDDLRDMVKQHLNPFRITVQLGSQLNASHSTGSSSTPLRPSQGQPPLQNLHVGVSEILKTVPEPLRETLVNLSSDLTCKALSSSPHIADLVDTFSKVGLSFIGQLSESQTKAQPGKNNEPKNSLSQTESKDLETSNFNATQTTGIREQAPENSESLKKFQPEEEVENDKLERANVSGIKMDKLLSRSRHKPVFSGPGTRIVCSSKKEKFKNIKDCYRNEKSPLVFSSSPTLASRNLCLEKHLGESSYDGSNHTVEEANKPSESHVEQKTAYTSAPDPVKLLGPSAIYGCPFPGTSSSGNLPLPYISASPAFPFGANIVQSDGTGAVFHCGVRCDGCGIHPITGPRFKSKVKMDYDLCSICFSEMGNSNDYIRMDRPAIHRNHVSMNEFCSTPQSWEHVCNKSSKLKSRSTKLYSRFIEDVNVFDGTVMAPLTPFTKIWRMRNSGKVEWPQKTQLVWIGGELLRDDLSVDLEIPKSGIPVDQEMDIAVDFVAPEQPGVYVSYWRMASPSGQQFGQRVWVLIKVDASVHMTPPANISGLNLNLPPVSSSASGCCGINLDALPIVEDCQPQTDNKKKTQDLVEPEKFQEMKFPINDSLLVGNGVSTSLVASPSDPFPVINKNVPQPPPGPANTEESGPDVPVTKAHGDASDSYPFAGLSATDPIIHVFDSRTQAAHIASPQEHAVELPGKKEVEEKLLQELDEMGFKEIDLNKEILRMNEYDLEQAVDDLCDVSDWDPILEELQEMGFHDTDMNKKLLEKNNGSIMRVVMDLIAREKN